MWMDWSNKYKFLTKKIYQIFVVDSSDDIRLEESKEELNALLTEPKLKKVPLMIFANKQDIQTSLSAEEVINI